MGDVLAGLVKAGRHRKDRTRTTANPSVTARVAYIHFVLAQVKQNGYCIPVSEMSVHISFVANVTA